jgi:hypothetical protein
MTSALALLVGAAMAGWLTPISLQRMDMRRRDPILMIVLWLVSMGGVLVAAASAVMFLLTPGHMPGATVLTTLHDCWSAIQHGSPPRVEESAGVLGVVLLLAFAARVVFVAGRGVRRRARARRERLAVLRLAARCEAGSPATLWLAHDRPLPFSLTGRHGVIVATRRADAAPERPSGQCRAGTRAGPPGRSPSPADRSRRRASCGIALRSALPAGPRGSPGTRGAGRGRRRPSGAAVRPPCVPH